MSDTNPSITPASNADSGSNASTDAWVRTRMCFCDVNAPTDCRFHGQNEKGWEECPNTAAAKTGQKLGRWLWGRNPAFNKISAAAEESLMQEAD